MSFKNLRSSYDATVNISPLSLSGTLYRLYITVTLRVGLGKPATRTILE